MTTKKADTTPPSTGLKKERGRYAKLLAEGFVIEIEIEPSKKRAAAAKPTGSAPASRKA